MKSFESPPQFNSENSLEKPINPEVKLNANATSPPLRVLEMKLKRYFDQLNQKDFDQLLDFDFQESLRDNPPIDGIFSPKEELEKIKRLPREQRKETLVIFKDNLARQREALATLRVFIERNIEFNHDTPKSELIRLIEKFGAKYGFDDRQKQISEKLVDRYFENRQKVLKIRRQFVDDHELVNELTGVNLDKNEQMNISVGPMTIDIDTSGFNAGRLYERANKPIIGLIYGGFASESVGENPIYYTVINQDVEIRKLFNDSTGEKTRRHEHEHQKNKLFRTVFEYKSAPTKLLGYTGEPDQEIRKAILQDFFDASRAAALEKVKNEITASLRDRSLSTLQKQLEQLFFSGKIIPYDYLAYLRNWEQFKDDALYQETVQKMLVQEYREIIQKAVDSYAELVKKGKYSTQKATAFLTDKPMKDWPKTIKRLLGQKKL